MDEEVTDPKNLCYPPGGILIWSLVLIELLTFTVASVALLISSRSDPQAFHESRLLLKPVYGLINTVFLLCSGYFMATSLENLKVGNIARSHRLLWFAIVGGGLFLALKALEYSEKISHGLTLGHDTFFTFYWLLTCFHVMHVLVGLVILLIFSLRPKSPTKPVKLEDYEAGAAFWHMCDLIWLILFPILYLVL